MQTTPPAAPSSSSEEALKGEAATDFERVAAELRALTANRQHTPAEVLQREGRDER